MLSGAYGSDGDLGPGADLFRGGSGSDGTAFVGEFGHLSGGRGSDRLIGGPGNDKLSGDLGNDFLKGDAGHDILVGGLGNDRLHSRDGEVDWVACGPVSAAASRSGQTGSTSAYGMAASWLITGASPRTDSPPAPARDKAPERPACVR